MSDEKQQFTVTETARELGISTRAVRSAVERGTLAAVPMGAIWLISRDAITAYQTNHRKRPGQSLRADPPIPPRAKPTRNRTVPESRPLVDVLVPEDVPIAEPEGRIYGHLTATSAIEPRGWYTIEQLCEVLGRGASFEARLHAMIEVDHLRAERGPGNAWRIPGSEVIRLREMIGA